MAEHIQTPDELADDLRKLGVCRGGVLLVHTSFRALRPVTGGPEGVLLALRLALGPEGTLVMPCWSGDRDAVFDPDATLADEDLGIVAETFRRQTGVQRSRHRFAFAAQGARAGELVADPICFPPHQRSSPVGRVFDRDGQILLLGVSHSANTTIHLAELEAGAAYRRFKHCTELRDGKPARIDYGENDHCCERFELVDGWMRAGALQAEGRVGRATARLMASRDLVAVVRERLLLDPLVFLHASGSGCGQCDEAHASLALR